MGGVIVGDVSCHLCLKNRNSGRMTLNYKKQSEMVKLVWPPGIS